MMPLIGEGLDFGFLLLNSSLGPIEQFYTFLLITVIKYVLEIAVGF